MSNLTNIPFTNNVSAIQPLSVVIEKALLNINMQLGIDNATPGLKTGFSELDKLILGLQNKDLIILAGFQTQGKSTFAINMVRNISSSFTLPVIAFSSQLPAALFVQRLLSSYGLVDKNFLHSKELDEVFFENFNLAMSQLPYEHFYLDDTCILRTDELRIRTQHISVSHDNKIGAILIDNLDSIKAPGKWENRSAEISEILLCLKALATEMNCPIILVSQLANRSLVDHLGKCPSMIDLYDSGISEQYVDTVLFIHKNESYLDREHKINSSDLILGKQKYGPKGVVRLAFQEQFSRFTD